MEITDYIIDIKDSSLQGRLRLRQVLLENGQRMFRQRELKYIQNKADTMFCFDGDEWIGSSTRIPNISLYDFIDKFKKHDQIRNLAIYKGSGELWTNEEVDNIEEFCGDIGITLTGVLSCSPTKKFIFDCGDAKGFMYTWQSQEEHGNFKNCLQIAYEDLFPQGQATAQPRVAVVTDNCGGFHVGSRIVQKGLGGLWSLLDDPSSSTYAHTIGKNCEWEDVLAQTKGAQKEPNLVPRVGDNVRHRGSGAVSQVTKIVKHSTSGYIIKIALIGESPVRYNGVWESFPYPAPKVGDKVRYVGPSPHNFPTNDEITGVFADMDNSLTMSISSEPDRRFNAQGDVWELVEPLTISTANTRAKQQGENMNIEVGSKWVRKADNGHYPAGEVITVENVSVTNNTSVTTAHYNDDRSMNSTLFLESFVPFPEIGSKWIRKKALPISPSPKGEIVIVKNVNEDNHVFFNKGRTSSLTKFVEKFEPYIENTQQGENVEPIATTVTPTQIDPANEVWSPNKKLAPNVRAPFKYQICAVPGEGCRISGNTEILPDVYPLYQVNRPPELGDFIVVSEKYLPIKRRVTSEDGKHSVELVDGSLVEFVDQPIYALKPDVVSIEKFTDGTVIVNGNHLSAKDFEKQYKDCKIKVLNEYEHTFEFSKILKHYDLFELTAQEDAKFKELLVALDHPLNVEAKEWALLVGESGSGKTELAVKYAKHKKQEYIKFQGSAQKTTDDLVGYKSITTGKYFRSLLREAVEFGKVFVLDEIDAMNPNTLIELNGLKQEYFQFPDKLVKVHDDFRFIATANTLEYSEIYNARSQMDKASIARFSVITYNMREEHLALRYGLDNIINVKNSTPGFNKLTPREIERLVRKLRIAEDLQTSN